MNVDFEYNGELASDYGLMICRINGSSDMETINVGAEINFNQTSIRNGSLFLTTDTAYDAPMETTFQVCKFDCNTSSLNYLTLDERRAITRWLNTKEPHIFRLIDDDDAYNYVIFEGMFNLREIALNGACIGFELTFKSNRPYALGESIIETITANTPNYEYHLFDDSDEVGYIYPKKMTVTLLSDTDVLEICNYAEDQINGRLTQIKNCVAGETITFTDMLTVSTSNTNHEITLQDDFNFCFFRIANSYTNKLNRVTVSSPCIIKIEYHPVVKGVGL